MRSAPRTGSTDQLDLFARRAGADAHVRDREGAAAACSDSAFAKEPYRDLKGAAPSGVHGEAAVVAPDPALRPLACALVRASAGTGKTYRLVETYVALVCEHGLPPSAIVAITFTRKAAAELRERIKRRLTAAGVAPALLAELARAPVSNFHGLALQLIQSYEREGGAGASGDRTVGSGAQVLGEDGDDRLLFLEACEQAWFGGEAGLHDAVATAAHAFSLDSRLPADLWEALARAREDGVAIDPAALLARYDAAALCNRYEREVAQLRDTLRAARSRGTGKAEKKIDEFLRACPTARAEMAQEAWAEACTTAAQCLDRRTKAIKEVVDEATLEFFKKGKLLERVRAESACARFRPVLAQLIDAAWHQYLALKAERRALDFGDLVERAVALLEQDDALHRRVAGRVRAILVDEAQDTNRLQRRFVHLLAGVAGPAAATAHGPATLIAVGDKKQAIYTFRGADPESFEAFAEDVQRQGGVEEQLTVSRRSAPELVAAINHLGETLFGRHAYEPLAPLPKEAGESGAPLGRPAMTWVDITVPAEARAEDAARLEATAVAESLRERLTSGGAAAGDFAILLSSAGRARLYLEALGRAGIPALLGSGSGFYEQAEVRDLAALLRWLVDPRDRMAAAIALRSPLFGLGDDTLVALFGAEGVAAERLAALVEGRLGARDCACETESEAAAVARAAGALPKLTAAAKVLGPFAMLRYVERELELEAAYLGGADGEQRLANVARLSEIALAFEEGGRGGVARFARELTDRIERGHGEPLAPVSAAARSAVTISTVHQAKGLEYPVVILCDLAHGSGADSGCIRYHRGQGLLLRPSAGGEAQSSEAWDAAAQEERALAEAELARLLYVAVTRARHEVLFFAARASRAPQRGFLKRLAPWASTAAEAHVLARRQTGAEPPSQAVAVTPSTDAAPAMGAPGHAYELSAALVQPALGHGTLFALPVTQLCDYLLCVRRGAFMHGLRLAEPGRAERPHLPPVDAPRLDPLTRGRVAHAIIASLERRPEFGRTVDFVGAELQALGLDPADARVAPVARDLHAFLDSPLGRMLADLPASARRHELPFVLSVAAAPYDAVVRGQMDLLYWDGDGPVVVDFKHARRYTALARAYASQLEVYAVAAARLCNLDVTASVRTRLVFLAERGEPIEHVVTPAMRAALLDRVATTAAELARAQESGGRFVPRAPAVCQEMECGYVTVCHVRAAPGAVPPLAGEANSTYSSGAR